MTKAVVIVSGARTPIGCFQGALNLLAAPRLGALAIKAALERAHVAPQDVSEVIMGEVLTAGVGQAPARQAAIYGGLPASVPCTTVNKVCGSGLKAVMLARQSILTGDAQIVVAGGMESMSNAPYLLPTARRGMRMGNQYAVDAMIHDGLWDPYGDAHMGKFGDQCAQHYGFSRQDQDAFAKASYERALAAQRESFFRDEITAVDAIDQDEEPSRFLPDKIGRLRPAFAPDGSVTAANASKINDGAAAVVVMSEQTAAQRNLQPLAQIVSCATFAQEPAWFTTAPVGAIQLALQKAQLRIEDIDLFEINEAFACVTMATMKELGISHDKVNVWGGAIALGHPIGCSGTRILVTLLSAMKHRNVRYGCASVCLGGGEAVAMVVKRGGI